MLYVKNNQNQSISSSIRIFRIRSYFAETMIYHKNNLLVKILFENLRKQFSRDYLNVRFFCSRMSEQIAQQNGRVLH